MRFSSFDFDVVTSPEEQEAVLARLRDRTHPPADQPAPAETEPERGAGEE